MRRTIMTLAVATLLAACTTSDPADTTSDTPATTTAETTAPTTEAPAEPGPAMEPAEVVFEAQESDGASIVVASVTLPSPGFIAVHGPGDGGPGPVIGHSALLPEGTSTDVVIELDAPLTDSATLFPMVHIDVNGNGEYEFFPPDDTTDAPAKKADGNVAVVGADVTVVTGEAVAPALEIVIASFSYGDPATANVGDTVLVRNDDSATHTWTSTTGAFNSGSLGTGDEFTFTFEEAGEYSFVCEIHPAMTGTITING